MKRPLRCVLFGHRFYWLDVNRRHHCKRCGTTDVRFVLQSRRIRQINPRFGCDCRECEAALADVVTPPGPTPLNGSESYLGDPCPEHGPLCVGSDCCCRDKHRTSPGERGAQ